MILGAVEEVNNPIQNIISLFARNFPFSGGIAIHFKLTSNLIYLKKLS
jgi:hypothetical protein